MGRIISLLLILLKCYIFQISLSVFELSSDTKRYFKDYFNLRIYSTFGELTIFVITGLFIGLQKTKTSSIIVGFYSIANIIFSLVFVLYFNLNVFGVALGTLVASTFTTIIFLFYTFFALSKITKLEFSTNKIFDPKKVKTIFTIHDIRYSFDDLKLNNFFRPTFLSNMILINALRKSDIIVT